MTHLIQPFGADEGLPPYTGVHLYPSNLLESLFSCGPAKVKTPPKGPGLFSNSAVCLCFCFDWWLDLVGLEHNVSLLHPTVSSGKSFSHDWLSDLQLAVGVLHDEADAPCEHTSLWSCTLLSWEALLSWHNSLDDNGVDVYPESWIDNLFCSALCKSLAFFDTLLCLVPNPCWGGDCNGWSSNGLNFRTTFVQS